MPAIDVVEVYRHLKTYGVRINGMRYPLDAFNAGILPVQPLPIALVLRVDGQVTVVRYREDVAPESRGDDGVIERVAALVRADSASDHDVSLAAVDDDSGYAAYAGGLSATTLMGLQVRSLNATGDGIFRNY